MMKRWVRAAGAMVLSSGLFFAGYADSIIVDARLHSVGLSLPQMVPGDPNACSIEPPASQQNRIFFDKGLGSAHFDVPPYYQIVLNPACDQGKGLSGYQADFKIYSSGAGAIAGFLRIQYQIKFVPKDKYQPGKSCDGIQFDASEVDAAHVQNRQVCEMNYQASVDLYPSSGLKLSIGTNDQDYPLHPGDTVNLPAEFLPNPTINRFMFYPYSIVIVSE